MKVFEVIASFLARERSGDPVFGLMGDANLAYLGAFIERHEGNYIAAALEGGSVSMADGWARMTGRPGVATVTFGPALTNTLTALTEAVRAKTPLVLIAGDTPAANEHFQYADTEGFARLAGARYERVLTASGLVETMAKAFVHTTATSQPVLLDIPFPLIGQEAEDRAPVRTALPRQAVAPDPDVLDEALGALLGAKRPFLLAGLGAVRAGARDAILALARALGAPVLTSLAAKDLFLGEPENLGIHGSLSTPAAYEHMGGADVLMSFGASLNNWQTDSYELLRGKHVIQSDIDPDALGKFGPIALGVVGDAKATAEALLEMVQEAGLERETVPAHLTELLERPGREAKDLFRPHTGDGFVDMREVALTLSEAVGAKAQQVSDVGRFTYSVWPHTTVDPSRWAYAGYFGAIGLGIATGIGAAAARSDVPTLVWAGDGGSMQGLIEVNTAVRHGLPLISVVLNDECYGAEYAKLLGVGSKAETSFIPWSSFAAVAQGLGAHGVKVTSREELETVAGRVREAAEALAAGRTPAEAGLPLVIEVMVDPHKVSRHPAVVPLD
ncbi:thiamine pyrophosphate-binding protein [Brevibacterium album]|uniref:thiamine pyrophosphate-binding protein n=1 Tax=Brevibacterium album TaxID=417948 RepID=UPI0004117E16|nr:thiamine pyrophosphate-binding protein [Brevibacterium album]